MPRLMLALLLSLTFLACSVERPPRRADTAGDRAGDIYDGLVFGIYKPLQVRQDAGKIEISGETFTYIIDKANGQIVSARALGTEFVARGTSFPNPYIGIMPPNDPGAAREGGADRKRFSFEKAVEIRPELFSGGLTGAVRHDAQEGADIATEVVSSDSESAHIRASGVYAGDRGPTPLTWTVDYRFDVDGFTRIDVGLSTAEPVKLRWHCFNHAWLDREAVKFISKYAELGSPPLGPRPAPTFMVDEAKSGEALVQSHWMPVMHLGNPLTGIDISKEKFDDRHSGYRDSRVALQDGRVIDTGSVLTADGEELRSHDSRGRRGVFTQVYARGKGLELEEFDIRNTTYALNPGDSRTRTFFIQLTPPKIPRNDLNSARIVWPGPHQIQMHHWRGRNEEWSPPGDEQLAQWAAMGVNIIVGGANYFSGDYSRPTHPDKIRRFLDTAHGLGMKVIPYVTFSDWNFEVPGYQEHAADWMNSADIEYAHHTTLMCFGAEGWRKHVEAECDSLLRKFDFDGLYVDHWFHTRYCNNERHGCGGYLGTFVTEGYHDFARRLRRLVARHTGGRGIMLLNSNNLISSTNLAWFDMRLLGENNDPLVLPGETIASTWNGKRQGVQSVIMWRGNQDALDMMNFCTMFGFSFRLRKSWNLDADILAEWSAGEQDSELGFNRLYWELVRFFGVNEAERFSAFDSNDILDFREKGSQVTAFARADRLLLLMGYLLPEGGKAPSGGSRPSRSETLSILQPRVLGLDGQKKYRVIDLAGERYLTDSALTLEELSSLDIKLTLGRARLLLVMPEQARAGVAFFRGADGLEVVDAGPKRICELEGAPGSPVRLYFDARGGGLSCETEGFSVSRQGDFHVAAGPLPEDRTVILALEQ